MTSPTEPEPTELDAVEAEIEHARVEADEIDPDTPNGPTFADAGEQEAAANDGHTVPVPPG